MKKVLAGILLLFLMGCIFWQPEESEKVRKENEKVKVVVTLLPQAEFAERIGGDRVQVTVMVPPGASPHTYEPTPGQLAEVSSAHIYAKVGSGVEFELTWMDKIVDANKDMLIIDCSQGVELMYVGNEEERENKDKGYDPHIWLSPKNAVKMVETIYEGLIQIAPSNKEYYERNKNTYIQELENLDEAIAQALSGKENKKIMVYHPSWTYFCRDYGLEQIPIEKEGKEPTPQGLAHLIDQAKTYEITVIFASPQFNAESAEVIAREINGKVVLIDPLAKNYIENMKKIAEAFAEVE